MFKTLLGASALMLALGAAPSVQASPLYFAFIETGQAGGSTGINATSSTTWSFTTGSGWTFGGGTFVMKDGPQTTADIILTIYQGTNASGQQVGQIALSNAQFDAQVAQPQAYAPHPFHFTQPVTLLPGTQYFVALTSPAPSNRDYFLKGSSNMLGFRDSAGNAMPGGFIVAGDGFNPPPITDAPTANDPATSNPPILVAEPAVLALFGLGLLALAALRLGSGRGRRVMSAAG